MAPEARLPSATCPCPVHSQFCLFNLLHRSPVLLFIFLLFTDLPVSARRMALLRHQHLLLKVTLHFHQLRQLQYAAKQCDWQCRMLYRELFLHRLC